MEHIETATPLAFTEPTAIEVRGARVHNLKNLSLDVPLRQLVGIAGVSGSGKSSLALGVLYAEGSRRYLEALSTYTRRRISQAGRATVDEVLHVPAALALRQRPGIPGVHSTFGTSTELLNYLRLMFSRLGCHVCPNGHVNATTLNVAAELPITCSTCGVEFYGPSAEDLAFNSGGACPTCGGTGVVRDIDESTLIADPNLTLEEGAVAPWRNLMWSLMPQVAREMGVRTDVPYRDLTDAEKDIVLHGPMEKRHILYVPKNKDHATELDFTYYSAVNTVRNALAKAKDEKGMARVAKFLCESVCPDCHGTRLSEKARSSTIDGRNLAQVTALSLDELRDWLPGVAPWLPPEMRPMCDSITSEMTEPIQRLEQLGLGYLTLDRASETLSNGERQRVALTRAVRSRTTGVLYVLDEPSIGLHPANIEGLLGVMDDLLSDGNSVVMVDHDVAVLRHANHLIEIGPGSGADGGRVIAQGSVAAGGGEPGQPHRAVSGRHGEGAGAHACRTRTSLRRRSHHAGDRHHPHRASAGGAHSERASDLRDGRVGLRKDNARARKPGRGAEGIAGRHAAAGACAVRGRSGHRAGRSGGRHAHRRERALHRGHLLRRAGRSAPCLRHSAGRQGAGAEGGRVLLQHRILALPHLRRHGTNFPGRAVPPRRGHPLPRLPRQPLRAGGLRHPNGHRRRRRTVRRRRNGTQRDP